MLMRLKQLTSYLLLILLTVIWLPPAQAGTIQALRGQRYCEILVAKTGADFPLLKVFNTTGLNQCPARQWNQLDSQQLKKNTKASFVYLNGPRYWVIDGMKNSSLINPKIVVFGGIAMREAGILHMRWFDFLQLHKPYKLHEVQRDTTWVYQANKPVFELIAPDKHVYIMQSYSIEKNNQTEASLSNLGTKLQLPAGWTFRTRTLKHDAYLTPLNQNAVVVQDDFLNTYQQETPNFIRSSM